jgi:hypothetical protein
MFCNASPHVPMSPRKFPETPSDVGQDEGIKSNPGLFALALSEHSGFNDNLTARTMTPPPQYTRHEQPRLTIVIPEEVQEEEEPNSLSSIEPSDEACEVLSTPAATSPSKQDESKLFLKVKAEVRRRGKGFRSKLRKATGSPKSGSASTTPSHNSPSSPVRLTALDASSRDQYPQIALPSVDGSVIQELDGTQIGPHAAFDREEQLDIGDFHRPPQISAHTADSSPNFRRNASVSSIIPTPRRGLSLASPSKGLQTSNVNSTDLTGRLQSIFNQNKQRREETLVSPCSPVSSTGENSRAWSSLLRSNAITDRVSGMSDPISPLSPLPSSPSPPPSTPTLDGRLDSLPRLTVAQSRMHSRPKSNQVPMATATHVSPVRKQFAELDCGKELLVPSGQDVANGWYSSPASNAYTNRNIRENQTIPRIAIEYAENAPEVVHHSNPTTFQGHNANRGILPQWPGQMYTGRPYQSRSPLAELTGSLWDAIIGGITQSSALLRQAYGPEPHVPEGHVRVRWRCVSN